MWAQASSILGYGAIGLGLLLAVLAYRLLSKGAVKERPIYVFEGFCLALVIVGAILQYSSTGATARAESAESRLLMASQVMNGIAAMVPDSIKNLQQVNGVLTSGGACGGGRGGTPLPHGSEMANLNSAVMNNLAAAKSAIEGLRQPK